VKTLSLVLSLSGFFLVSQTLVGAEEAREATADRLQTLQKENAALRQSLAQKEAEINSLRTKIGEIEQREDAAIQTPPVTWENEVALGGSLTRGNTDSYTLQAKITSTRETALDKLRFRLTADLQEIDTRRATERVKGEAKYDRNITEKFYWYTRGSGEHDQILGIDYRAQVGPGLGYYLFKTETVKLSLETGPGYQAEKLKAASLSNTIQGRGAENFEWKITNNLKFFQSAEFLSDLLEVNDFTVALDAGFESSLTKQLSLRLTAEDRYNAEPAQGKKKNDIGLITSVAWKF
jgi:putative salt-induced outer membrane protein YdiY